MTDDCSKSLPFRQTTRAVSDGMGGNGAVYRARSARSFQQTTLMILSDTVNSFRRTTQIHAPARLALYWIVHRRTSRAAARTENRDQREYGYALLLGLTSSNGSSPASLASCCARRLAASGPRCRLRPRRPWYMLQTPPSSPAAPATRAPLASNRRRHLVYASNTDPPRSPAAPATVPAPAPPSPPPISRAPSNGASPASPAVASASDL